MILTIALNQRKRMPKDRFYVPNRRNNWTLIDLYIMLILEMHVFELRIAMKFEVWDPRSFFNTTHIETNKAWTGL